MPFTADSFLAAIVFPNRTGHPRQDRETEMALWTHLTHYRVALREFIAPTYRPERHYMRGPGPACARRGGLLPDAGATFHSVFS